MGNVQWKDITYSAIIEISIVCKLKRFGRTIPKFYKCKEHTFYC